jgi:hypothetical protein
MITSSRSLLLDRKEYGDVCATRASAQTDKLRACSGEFGVYYSAAFQRGLAAVSQPPTPIPDSHFFSCSALDWPQDICIEFLFLIYFHVIHTLLELVALSAMCSFGRKG